MITRESAVLAFDLAADKQVCALTDQDSVVLARRTVRCKAWELSEAVGWGLARAAEAGFSHVVVACEPTGHRWRVLDQIAAELGVALVCVQPLLVRAGPGGRGLHPQQERRHRRDDHRPVGRPSCAATCRSGPTRPGRGCGISGARRAALLADVGAARQQLRDLLECAWPAVLDAAAEPLESSSWLAAITVVLDRVGASGDLSVIRRWGWARFAAAVRRELGATALVLHDRARGVRRRHRPGPAGGRGGRAARAAPWNAPASPWPTWPHATPPIAEVETRMLAVLDQLDLTELVTTHPRAVRGRRGDDPGRDRRPDPVPAPGRWSNTPGCARATTPRAATRAGPPSAAAAAPSCGWPPGGRCSARCTTTRCWPPGTPTSPAATDNPLTDTQARVAVAASLLRQLHAVIVTRSAPGTPPSPPASTGARTEPPPPPDHPRRWPPGGASPHRRRDPDPATDHEQPRPSPTKPG